MFKAIFNMCCQCYQIDNVREYVWWLIARIIDLNTGIFLSLAAPETTDEKTELLSNAFVCP